MALASNEKTKLTAAFLNGTALAVFAIGGLTPLYRLFEDSEAGKHGLTVLAISTMSIVVSWIIHGLARRTLDRLVE